MISKGNHKKKKRKGKKWEKIFANNAANKRSISKIYKQLIQLNINKTKQFKSKNGFSSVQSLSHVQLFAIP